MLIRPRNLSHVVVISIVVLFIFATNMLLTDDSCIRSPADLAFIFNKDYILISIYTNGQFLIHFNTNKNDSQNAWVLHNRHLGINSEAPFKYRILGNYIAMQTRHFFGNEDGIAFYRSYIFWCLIFLIGSSIIMYYSACLFVPEKIALFSVILLQLAPSYMYIFKYPNCMTVNDPLNCLLTSLAIYFCLSDRYILSTATVICGVFCRETILIVPLFGMFYLRIRHLFRLLFLMAPLLIWIVFRYISNANHLIIDYSPHLGGLLNISNMFESCAYIFTIFGAIWIFVLLGFYCAFTDKSERALLRFDRSALIPFLVTIGFHSVFAVLGEMRISLFTFGPFAIFLIATAFERITHCYRIHKYYLIYILGIICLGIILFKTICLPANIYDYLQLADRLGVFLIGIPIYHIETAPVIAQYMINNGWAGIAIIHLTCLLMLLPICIMSIKLRYE